MNTLLSVYIVSHAGVTAHEPAVRPTWRDATNRLSVRSRRILERLEVASWDELALLTRDDLLMSKNCGITATEEIMDFASRHGIRMRDE